MSIIYLIVAGIILAIVYQYITAKYLVLVKDPPRPVGIAGMLEGVFGVLLWGLFSFYNNRYLDIFFFFLGIFWIGVAVSLYRGSRTGRTICLVLSILRIPTIIGILFSVLSIKLLYFNPN